MEIDRSLKSFVSLSVRLSGYSFIVCYRRHSVENRTLKGCIHSGITYQLTSLSIMAQARTAINFNTFARWRPLSEAEVSARAEVTDTTNAGLNLESASPVTQLEISRTTALESNDLYSITLSHPTQDQTQDQTSIQKQHLRRRVKTSGSFKQIFEVDATNTTVFESVVEEAIDKVLRGENCGFFAYGHTGSGKTWTVVGGEKDTGHGQQGQQDKEQGGFELGLFPLAARRLFESLEGSLADDEGREEKLGVAFSLFELRKNVAVDLLNNRTQCHIRQGADGKTHVRGETEILEDGKVRVKPIMKQPCWSYTELYDKFRECLNRRSIGNSTVHDQSSRTHAVLELEIVNERLVEARNALYERQAELVPVGKRATEIYLEEVYKTLMQQDDGTWKTDPKKTLNQVVIDAAEADKAECEHRVEVAEQHIDALLAAKGSLGGKMIFVDLAGSEYHNEQGIRSTARQPVEQTLQEKQEGRQINTDLFALKEVIRAHNSKQDRIPFRTSPLTMVLREHFLAGKGASSAMIVTVSPAVEHYNATRNTLKYGSLVGAACG